MTIKDIDSKQAKVTESEQINLEQARSDSVTEKGLLKKIKPALKLLGREALTHVFLLYYTLKAPETPLWCRSVILGALGYFFTLFDSIPDLTPILGYTDDITVMAAAIATIAVHITPESKQKAEQGVNDILATNS